MVEAALNCLRKGECVVYPTETLYGLGADAENENAILRLISIKGREEGKPIPVIVSDIAMLARVVSSIPPLARRLMEIFWPGPLTLVLQASERLPSCLLGPNGTIGVRISSHPVAQEIVTSFGRPITSTSVNPSEKTPAKTLEEARAYFGDRVAAYVEGGNLSTGVASTVMEVGREAWKIIREGAITEEAIVRAIAMP
jgi:L-threonylcarbamoyladenylate synthase